MASVIGWDIGGANTKAARVLAGGRLQPAYRPFEIQHDPTALAPLLHDMARELGATPRDRHAVTMTAELSQAFRTKRAGVAFVLDAMADAFGAERLAVYTVHGRFVDPSAARRDPIAVAASNWTATASWVARFAPDALLIDIGTTTTDIVPILDGTVVAKGRTDPDRLCTGELVYTGAVRTPAEAVAREVPLQGARAGVSAEGFALMGDVHLWLGALPESEYTVRAPDGRAATRELAGERIARVVCGDRELLGEDDVDAIARALAEAQVAQVREGIARVRARVPTLAEAVVTGVGEFIARQAAEAEGLTVVRLADRLGSAARIAPAACVALLLADELARTPA